MDSVEIMSDIRACRMGEVFLCSAKFSCPALNEA